jgi:hypothetical protein
VPYRTELQLAEAACAKVADSLACAVGFVEAVLGEGDSASTGHYILVHVTRDFDMSLLRRLCGECEFPIRHQLVASSEEAAA